VDRILRRQLDAIARDNHSGASALVSRAISAIQQRARRRPAPAEHEWLETAKHILRAKPSMAPFLRLANEILLALDDRGATFSIMKRVSRFGREVHAGPAKIARRFCRLLRSEDQPLIQTYSYSSTVLASLLAAKRIVTRVWCAESRPANEGKAMAQRLAEAGIPVDFSTDACLTGQLWRGHIILLGADALLTGWVAGKVGVKAIIQLATANGCRVYIAADTTKFWPEASRARHPRWNWTFGPDRELWKNPPKNVEVYNLYFELVQYRKDSRFRFLTERGLMTPTQVRREIAKITLSPRLKDLLD
jgi:translation initiation factor 2B subunit (eIF-2B alpha/beta/delta family)